VQLAALNRDRLATGSLIQDACEVLACLRGSKTCHVYIVQRCCGKGQGLCKEGDEMMVKVIGIDRASGKVRLSRREALGKTPDVVHNLKAGFST
jgi:hypothetical protein